MEHRILELYLPGPRLKRQVRETTNVLVSKSVKQSKCLMCGGTLRGIFMFSSFDNNQGNVLQLVQTSPLINKDGLSFGAVAVCISSSGETKKS